MTLPPSNSDTQSFEQLDRRIQHWIWREGWTSLREAQERAIPALIHADRDVIVAAATAAGKTEAAFFPILTHLLRQEPEMGSVLYISPLKALINDQWERLHALCETLDIPVVGWHGDVATTQKQRFLKTPRGVLLITPESLEALFVTRGTAMPGLMAGLRYIVIDELHAFIGSERGKQLQSLVHRVERLAGHRVPRVGLSATLGDMQLAACFLRPADPQAVLCIESTENNKQFLKIGLKGVVEDRPPRSEKEAEQPLETKSHIVDDLYKILRGSNNLVFPNRRTEVEYFTDALRRKCEKNSVPNEFWAHHGSLAKEFREEAEYNLKRGDRPVTAICTSTLELGIDIGSVKNVCQIGSPPSVASLRQRLGRSGRRKGEPSILRAYCIESSLDAQASLTDRLREDLIQSVAMIRLLLERWVEPPRVGGIHGSTLIQQILSIIAERGGETATRLWETLASPGSPFDSISREDFALLLRHMGELSLLTQESSGLLLHGEKGERCVNHYSFFCAFPNEEEFRLEHQGRTLGSLPLKSPLFMRQTLIFAGQRWCVIAINTEKKFIVVETASGGAPPPFSEGSGMIHDRVRQEMRLVLAEETPVSWLDPIAQNLLEEARRTYREASLHQVQILDADKRPVLLTWRGDAINYSLVLLLTRYGLSCSNEGMAIQVSSSSKKNLFRGLNAVAELKHLDPVEILEGVENINQEKWDWALPSALGRKSFSSLCLDLEGARETAEHLAARVRP